MACVTCSRFRAAGAVALARLFIADRAVGIGQYGLHSAVAQARIHAERIIEMLGADHRGLCAAAGIDGAAARCEGKLRAEGICR
ncbi:hypothetical protein [Luteimonas sp. R10]|uniref:hypothetical protein n=1 Tax=Luteimonas sp. R10 TaxID=3108176 RepID=UPI00308ECEAA|nr:hypothetical protein U3649_00410 [Luteimonas sp. R10]